MNEEAIKEMCIRNLDLPGAVPHRQISEVIEFHHAYTVPILSFEDTVCVENFVVVASGVLFQIGGMYFILTAGHVVKNISKYLCRMGIQRKEFHDFTPLFVHSNFVFNETSGADFGYLQMFPDKARTLLAAEKVFAGKARIYIPESLERDDDIYSVGGFPNSMLDTVGNNRQALRLFCVNSTIVSDVIAAHSRQCQWDMNTMGFSLEILLLGPVRLDEDELRFTPLPKLTGMSGGGCWKANVYPKPEEWTANRFKLAAIHTTNTLKNCDSINNEWYYFLREVRVGHHLALIACDYSVLRNEIFDEWPILNSRDFNK